MGLWKDWRFGQGWGLDEDTELICGFCHDCMCGSGENLGLNTCVVWLEFCLCYLLIRGPWIDTQSLLASVSSYAE